MRNAVVWHIICASVCSERLPGGDGLEGTREEGMEEESGSTEEGQEREGGVGDARRVLTSCSGYGPKDGEFVSWLHGATNK